MRSIDPTTGTIVREVAGHDLDGALALLGRAHAAFEIWRGRSFEERAAPLRAMAVALRERAPELARLMACEMGKPVREGRAEAEKCAWVCEHFAEHARALLAPEEVASDASRSYVCFEPLGVALAIMPWNFPLWQVFRMAAPALMAGNAVLLKPAPGTPGCAVAVEELGAAGGLPPGALSNAFVPEDLVPALIARPEVAAVTLTGSTRAGRAVAREAGASLKKVVLELGGSDPYVVLADADLDAALDACAFARLLNAGQSCIAAKRFVVVPEVRAAFERGLVERFRAVRVGDPRDEETGMGPLARRDLREELERQVRESLARGARALLGGELPAAPPYDGPGAFYPPTVLTEVTPGQPAYEEELFGPVAAILPAADEAEALRIANDTRYGLGAAVFTRDSARGERLAREELSAGCCFVNAFVRSDPRLSFGGVRESGIGRELGALGLRELVNAKTVYVA